jgi:hypothetical protein
MHRRELLRSIGPAAIVAGLSGCLADSSPTASTRRSTEPTETAPGSTGAGPGPTEPVPRPSGTTRETTEAPRETVESAAEPTDTTDTTDTTVESTGGGRDATGEAPDGPTGRLLRAGELEGGSYELTGAPAVSEGGTIVGRYRSAQPYPRTLRIRVWPCRGEALDALGGKCSLGGLPERYREDDSVETTVLEVGETAFAWWSGPATDVEVVTADHVFRITHRPAAPRKTRGESTGSRGESGDGLPPRAERVAAVTRIARRQATKLEGLDRTSRTARTPRTAG